MDTLPSSKFRKTYASLKEPVGVTVNGHLIGEWTPVQHARYLTIQEAKTVITSVTADARAVMTDQAKRDAILRKINKGG